MLMTVLSDDAQYYYAFKELVHKIFESLGTTERFNMYAVMQNYCIQRGMKGEEKFYTELFEVYTFMLENNVYVRRALNYAGTAFQKYS